MNHAKRTEMTVQVLEAVLGVWFLWCGIAEENVVLGMIGAWFGARTVFRAITYLWILMFP